MLRADCRTSQRRKSTLFNALVANAKAEAANFLCTIQMWVSFPRRIIVLADISNSAQPKQTPR